MINYINAKQMDLNCQLFSLMFECFFFFKSFHINYFIISSVIKIRKTLKEPESIQ